MTPTVARETARAITVSASCLLLTSDHNMPIIPAICGDAMLVPVVAMTDVLDVAHAAMVFVPGARIGTL